MENETYMKRLKDRLQIEFKKQDRSGVYGFTQRSMAYNSNRIEGSTLTEKQTASMFETGTLYADDPDMIFRTKDIEEMNGHFKMFDYVMKCMKDPLSEDIIKNMHKNLKEGFLKIEQMDMQLVGGKSVQTESAISRQHCRKKFQKRFISY
ncbi:MAG: hypothetical protein ACLUTO_02180 [Anaerostipes sp.]